MTHTVEKIGGTSMSRLNELRDTLFIKNDEPEYGRIFVVSAFGGITNLLLEHKKTGAPGVYARFANAEDDHGWFDALNEVSAAMIAAHEAVLDNAGDVAQATAFVQERIEGARNCLIDLQRLCSYGHFRLNTHLLQIRELLSGLGEAHSALVAVLMLQRAGVNARLVDLSGWRGDADMSLEQRIETALEGVDPAQEMPIVTGYAQCAEGLMREFDRGYSEVTFSQLAAQTGAREAIIHKEFHLSSADPKLVGAENARKLGHTNYDVADQMANLGMEAIHPSAAKTLRQSGVPLRVTNCFEPNDPGTVIDDQPAPKAAAEIVTGLDIIALELFEQDMVGVKGYDAAVLDILTRHNVRIVSKVTNANTVTHYLDASLKSMRRVEADLLARFPQAEVNSEKLSLISVVGRDLSGLHVLARGMNALEKKDILPRGATQGPRNVDTQFILQREDKDAAIALLHSEFFGSTESQALKAA
ncbi:MAG: aspartate kinase [Pseudophaeobacter sp. bin_em_oilr2.035]|uniref:aspartate kinase n=1 Tax=Phaeobacter gallaeciensis TaxID=60890 RepID=A0ABD4X6D3_9RHOB|nr:aspartate kinase [Phaeobacter gallaeciensis]MDF1771110.1 aspartate kinase [Pseudophaeobacter sp. bin_em_oilr2.035]MDE4099094.1 aspartate kinase [Phaeobacter gallaeciensis]MDE4107904.1 aspartate kinase [Phaeobacter gallaeciensis]MDE4112358.1 aspartate kinase [Phaeobacter gallaeciensis]MDE4116829.1 aspartate kinase [Phaeobacter gallaeciensis]